MNRRQQDIRHFRIQLGLTLGICLVMLAVIYAPVRQAWEVNRASILVNRAIVQKNERNAPANTSELKQAMSLMEDAASRKPSSPLGQASIWRTYGEAASILPSEYAYQQMLRARNTGKLDNFGELSLGEVAASTRHWDVADQAFARIDATNLLINRADKLKDAGNPTQAIHEYLLAKQSLDAAYKRSSAKALLLDRAGQEDSSYGSLTQQPGEKATFLYKIGRGILDAGDAEKAIPILDEALQSAQSHSPGLLLKQSIYFNLAQALASSVSQTVASEPWSSSQSSSYFMVDSSQYGTTDTIDRARALTYVGLKLSVTAESSLEAGNLLLKIGDDIDGVRLIQQALELNPRFKEAYLTLAQQDIDVGMPVTAREVYKQASEILPSDADLLNKYLWACYKTMAPRQVLPIVQKAMTSRAKNDYLYEVMADCYTDLKLTSDAITALQEGLRAYPDSQALADQLQDLERQTRN